MAGTEKGEVDPPILAGRIDASIKFDGILRLAHPEGCRLAVLGLVWLLSEVDMV